jgi:hypothetical protein
VAASDWKPEFWVAIYAAVVGTGALLLNFKSWLESGVKLRLALMARGMLIGGGPGDDRQKLMILTVTNRGDASTTINSMVLYEMNRPWRRLLRKPNNFYLIPHPQLPGYPPNTPSFLEPGKSWTGHIDYGRSDMPNIHSGDFYVGVSASHRRREYLVHIPRSFETREGQVL